MKKILLSSILLASFVNAEALTPEQKMEKEMIIKIIKPTLELAKKIKECMNKDSKEEYKTCIISTRKIASSNPLGKAIVGDTKQEIDYKGWKNKEAEKELDKAINAAEKTLQCANDPKTTDFNKCADMMNKK